MFGHTQRVPREPRPHVLGHWSWFFAVSLVIAFAATTASADPVEGQPVAIVLENSQATGEWATVVQAQGAEKGKQAIVTVNATGVYDVLVLAQISAHQNGGNREFFRLVLLDEKDKVAEDFGHAAITGPGGNSQESTVTLSRLITKRPKGPLRIALQSSNANDSLSGQSLITSLVAFEIVNASDVLALKSDFATAANGAGRKIQDLADAAAAASQEVDKQRIGFQKAADEERKAITSKVVEQSKQELRDQIRRDLLEDPSFREEMRKTIQGEPKKDKESMSALPGSNVLGLALAVLIGVACGAAGGRLLMGRLQNGSAKKAKNANARPDEHGDAATTGPT